MDQILDIRVYDPFVLVVGISGARALRRDAFADVGAQVAPAHVHFELVDERSLQRIREVTPSSRIIAAAKLSETWLIDNIAGDFVL